MSVRDAPPGATEVTTAARVALLPLTPSYDASNHETYVKAIEDGLSGAVCNIALTGSYGVGKSSVLQEIAAKHEKTVVQISLSTLGLSDEQKSDPASGAAVTKTNLIQKEIVKQLLYREDPAKMRGSRYRRIGRFQFWRGLLQAALVGLTVTLVFFLAGWTKQLAGLVPPDIKLGLYPHVVVFVAVTAFALALEWLFHNRIHVERLSAGAATIALSGESGTYFDEYLDEIVYFFDITGRDIVIFEDIDRFDDPHIFETLRALNSLLNRAGQLKGRRIRFIYAIKDSIFDELGVRAAREEGDIEAPEKPDAVNLEMARANRTKFFDLVIPVVPFITHRSARDLMDKVMKESGSTISSDLIDLSARHLVDMRLIKNVHNEFVIFREKILGGEGTRLGLSEDVLFAMMLYKSTHLSDFEDIKLGKSKIDRLYQDSRQIVAQNMATLASEETAVRRRLANLDSVAKRSTSLGAGLLKYIAQLERQSGATRTALRYARANVDPEHFKTSEFWDGFLSADEPVEAHVQTRNGYPVVFSIARQDIEAELRVSLSPQDWQKSDLGQLQERLQKIRKDREFLRSADMGDLFARDEFKLAQEESEPCSLRELAVEHFDSELAQQLVASGYIDRNFTLYTSTYYADRVSSQATNFMIHSVDPDVMDPHFELAAHDVEAVLAERGESVLRERGMYNIAVLDYLLAKNDKRAEPLIRSLMAGGDDARQFLVTYISNGNRQIELVGRLAEAWPLTLQFVLEDAEVDDSTRTSLANVALGDIVGGIDYVVDDTVREFFELGYQDLEVLTSDGTSPERADIFAKLFADANVRLADLSRVAGNVRRSMVAQHRYTISRENLVLALEGAETLALDQIRAANPAVYAHVLDNLPAYLDAIGAGQPSKTVENPENFEVVLKDVSTHDESQLPHVVSRSASTCRVHDLTNVPEASWPFLADGKRFPATFANVRAYLGEAEQIDEHLAQVLEEARTIEIPDDAAEADKVALAKSILQAAKVLPDPDLRTQLVTSLELENWLPLDLVPHESGELIGSLIAAGVVADDADTFSLALDLDWKTREFVMGSSEEFAAYMTPTEVAAADVAPLLRSEMVPKAIKDAVLARSAEFVPDNDRAALTTLAQYALASGDPVTPTELARWALARVDAPLIVRLLDRVLPQISLAELVPVLEALGGDYASASARNGKRPKLPNTEWDMTLVKRLQELEVASTYEVSQHTITVNMRKAL